MKLPRRNFLRFAAGAAVLPAASQLARAQTYPARPVRIIVGFAAGATADILARLIAQWLQERLGQPFVVENRPGAGSNLALETVVRAPADGYTLLWVTSTYAVNATMYDKLSFNFMRDIAPVAGVVRTPIILEVNPSAPVKTVPEFIAYAKASSGGLNMGSAGTGTPQHVSGELFRMMTGASMVHVPYRGEAPAIADLMGGQVQVMFGTLPGSIEYIRAGKLRALGVSMATRLETLPDLPTIAESVPGYEANGWIGLGAPASTPAEIVERLNREINAGLSDPKLKARLADLGAIISGGSPADFAKYIADETEKWAKVVKFANIKAE